MTIRTKAIDYDQGGETFEGFLAWNDSVAGPLPGVIVSHAWGGAGQFEQQCARDLAALGYAGFCLDLYGKGIRGSTREENAKLMQPLLAKRELLQQRMKLALAVVRARDEVDASRVAAMGFCFGGLCVLDLARTGADVLGVVSVHGLFVPPGNTAGNEIGAKVLALHGWSDPLAPPEQVSALAKELTTAGCDWQIHAFGHTLHAFTNPEAREPDNGFQFSESATNRSWKLIGGFLAELF